MIQGHSLHTSRHHQTSSRPTTQPSARAFAARQRHHRWHDRVVKPIVCSAADCAQYASVAVQNHPAASAQKQQLVKTRVLKNRSGLYRIRHLQENDLAAVAQLQAASFHEALPLKPLDDLAFTMFKAEVLSAVQKKTRVLADDGFTILVVESCASPAAAAATAAAPSATASSWPGTASASSSSSSSDLDAAVWYGDQQAVAAAAGGGGQYGSSSSWQATTGSAASSSSSGQSHNHILGVIEVGVQDEADVLQHMPRGMETYAYISSMAVAAHVRRCGIGAALLQAAEQQAVLWGQQLLALHVYETNERAIKLYQSHGLVSHAADPAWRRYVGGKVRQLMVKWL